MKDNRDFSISWKTCLRVGICILILFLCFRYWNAVESFVGLFLGGMLAILAGLVIAYIANIPLRFFERKLPGETGDGTRNRLLALILSIVCIVAVVLFVGILVIPQLVDAIVTLAQDAPEAINALANNEFLRSFIPATLIVQLKSIDWQNIVTEVASWLQSGIVSSLPQITSLIGQIGAWFMGIVLAFWFLAEKNKLSNGVHVLIRTYIGKNADKNFSHAIEVADRCFRGYFVGQSLEGLLFGTIVTIVCVIARIPNAFMLGALVGVMSLIPMVGAIIGAILGAVIILATSWEKALIFLILFFIVQQIEANVLYPRVVGKQVGLTGMWPLIGITMGVALFGFVGAFIGVPLTATIFRIVKADIARREQTPGESATPLEKLQQSLLD